MSEPWPLPYLDLVQVADHLPDVATDQAGEQPLLVDHFPDLRQVTSHYITSLI